MLTGSFPGCLKVQKNNGYMEFLATLGDWVYYDCPVEHAFSEDDCACVYTGGENINNLDKIKTKLHANIISIALELCIAKTCG